MKWTIYCLPTEGIKTKRFFLCTLETMYKEKRPPRAIPQRTSRIYGSYKRLFFVTTCCVDACPPLSRSERLGMRTSPAGDGLTTRDDPKPSRNGPVNFLACSDGTRTRQASRQSVWGQYFSSATAARLFCTGKHIDYGVRAKHTHTLSWGVRLHLR